MAPRTVKSTHCMEFCTGAGDIADEISLGKELGGTPQVPPPTRIVDDDSLECKF